MRQEEKADAWAAEDPSLFEGKQTVDANSITMFRTYPSRVQDSRVYHQLLGPLRLFLPLHVTFNTGRIE